MKTLAFCLILALAAPAAAQVVSPGLEQANPEMTAGAKREVQQRVEQFLAKLGSRDMAAVRAMFTPKALVAAARQQRDGSFANTYLSVDEYLAQFEKVFGQSKFEEPLANVLVTIDSERLAYVRADFRVLRDGKVQSSGVDHFMLLKEADGWKIALVAFTSIPAAGR